MAKDHVAFSGLTPATGVCPVGANDYVVGTVTVDVACVADRPARSVLGGASIEHEPLAAVPRPKSR